MDHCSCFPLSEQSMRAQKSPKGLLTALQPQLACESEAQKAGEEVHLSLRTELLGALW
jgi:hypothetical protein